LKLIEDVADETKLHFRDHILPFKGDIRVKHSMKVEECVMFNFITKMALKAFGYK